MYLSHLVVYRRRRWRHRRLKLCILRCFCLQKRVQIIVKVGCSVCSDISNDTNMKEAAYLFPWL